MKTLRPFLALLTDTLREAWAGKQVLAALLNGLLSALVLLVYVQTIAARGPGSKLGAMAVLDPRLQDPAFVAPFIFGGAAQIAFWLQVIFSLSLFLLLIAPLLTGARNAQVLPSPVPRHVILFARFSGVFLVLLIGPAISFTLVWVATAWKTGLWHWPFWAAAAVTLLVLCSQFAMMTMFQLLFRSPMLALVGAAGLGMLNVAAQDGGRLQILTGSPWTGKLAQACSWLVPRISELATWTNTFVSSGQTAHAEMLWSTALSALVYFAIAAWRFTRQEF